jgi:general secretion pathway protein F
MKYRVRALTADQSVMPLLIDALDEADARRQVQERGLFIARISQASEGLGSWSVGTRRTAWPLVLFSQELLALLHAGLGLVEGLEALLEKEANPSLRPVLSALLQALMDGKRFSTALAEQPGIFPALYIGVVRSAEGTSDLPRALQRYIDYQQRIDAVRAKVVSAAIYPAILMSVGGVVSLFLIVYVVPRFAEVYKGAGRELPWMSAMLLNWGAFAAAHTMVVLGALAVMAVGLALGWRHLQRQGGIMSVLSLLPSVGERVHVYELARMYLTLGMLLEGGIALVPAMETIADVVSPRMRLGLAAARSDIESGMPLSQAFQAHGLTTPISLRMLSVGERSGDLGGMLTQSAAFYDGEISRWIDRFMRSFEPLLMAAIGLVVGVIVILLYMPIFDLAGNF